MTERLSSLVDPATGQPFRLSAPPLRRGQSMAAFEAASFTSQELAGWHPAHYSADTAIGPERRQIAARIHDLVRNDGWASGAVTAFVDSVIGPRLRWISQPDWRALGITRGQGEELGKQLEAVWRRFSEDPLHRCDGRLRLSVSGLWGLAFRHLVKDGDALLLPLWRERSDWPFRTCFAGVHPARLSNPHDGPDQDSLRQGIELDADGAALAYHFRRSHPGEERLLSAETFRWDRVQARLPFGRPGVIHHFVADEEGQTRGVSVLAPLVRRLRMNTAYERAEAQAAVLNAVFAAWIESSLPTQEWAEMLEDSDGRRFAPDGSPQKLGTYEAERLALHNQAPVQLGGTRLPVLPLGDRINTTDTARPNTNAEQFVDLSLRYTAAALGLNPSTISRNYSNTNYSSERAAMLEAWRRIEASRFAFVGGMAVPSLYCVMEEAVERGLVDLPSGAPGFWEAPGAYLAGTWIGPARGWVDPTKEAQGAQMRLDNLTSTLAAECAAQGLDYSEVVEQRAREKREIEEAGLAPARWTMTEAEGPGGEPVQSYAPAEGSARRPARGRSRIPQSGVSQ